jgi:type II secretory pathway pseudopilin PulG
MAALLVAMSVMAVMLTVAMPVWKHAAQREKEEELVFRGMQYVHAIGLFQRKYANAYPPNIDVLVDQRFLRRKYKDPITNDDFQIIPAGTNLPGGGQPTGQGQRGGGAPSGGAAQGGRGVTTLQTGTSTPQTGTSTPQTGARGTSPIGTQGGGTGMQTTAGISGVTSKSKNQSIRLYNGRNHYNEWAFVYMPQLQAGQGGVPGSAAPGQRGQPGRPGGPGGPGVNPSGRPTGPGNFNPSGRPGGPGGNNPFNPFNPNNPSGGRPTAPGPVQPIFPPQPTGRGRL